MASLQFKFLFPHSKPLQPEKAIFVLSKQELQFDPIIRPIVAIDSQGHLIDAGDEVKLSEPITNNLQRRLSTGEQFSISCRNSEIIIECFFAHHASNPYIYFAWSQKLFSELEAPIQTEYLKIIQVFAKNCNAGYVIEANYVSDKFEDQFPLIHNHRHFYKNVNDKNIDEIQSIWVDETIGATLPTEINASKTENIGNGFQKYSVIKDII